MSIKNESVQGDLSVSRNITAGGKFQSRGNATFDHDVQIKGWLEVSNLKDVCKGLYATEEALKAAYPRPTNGWFAYVGDTLPADVYRAENGAWVKTGQKGGETNIYLDEIENDLESLRDDLNENVGQIQASSSYVTCTTGAGTAAKTVSLSDFALSTGIRLVVKMSYANTAASATLNVNNTGAKPMYYNGAVASADNSWDSNEIIDVFYDGTNYQAFNIQGGSTGGNQVLEWNTSAAATRLQIPIKKRQKGTTITYVNPQNETVNEQYVNKVFTDAEWQKDTNWVRYSMANDTRISLVRSSFVCIGYKKIEYDKFNSLQRLPIIFLQGNDYAVYIKTNFPTETVGLVSDNVFSVQLFPQGDINLENGYLYEFNAKATGAGIRINTQRDFESSDYAEVYIYDLSNSVTDRYEDVGALKTQMDSLTYRMVYRFKNRIDLRSSRFDIPNYFANGVIGDNEISKYDGSFSFEDTIKPIKYLIRLKASSENGTATTMINGLYCSYLDLKGVTTSILSEENKHHIGPSGFIQEVELKDVEQISLLRFTINVKGIDAMTVDTSMDIEVDFYEVYETFDDNVKNVDCIKNIRNVLGIKDEYELKHIYSYIANTYNTSIPANKSNIEKVEFLEPDTLYYARLKAADGGICEVNFISAYSFEDNVIKSKLGYCSLVNKKNGYYVFMTNRNLYEQEVKAGRDLGILIECVNSNLPLNLQVDIYTIRIKNSIYDGMTDITYSVDKKLPVGLTRVDISSLDISVKEDHTLSGVPCENVDFKYTFDNGRVFTSKANIDYQGTSSMSYKKKNLEFDLIGEEGESVDLKIGLWKPMDSYHLKANWIDATHCRNIICARIMEQIYMSRAEKPWDAYNDFPDNSLVKHIDTGALGHIDGFPVEVYINNEYIGLYTFNLKKHRSNYNMEKNNTNHIQLEMAGYSNMNASPISWNQWEIRNPKSDSGNEEFKELEEPNDGEVKTSIERLMEFANGATLLEPTYTKEDFENYLNVPFWLDYILFNDFTTNFDGIRKNTQLCTWDGLHWSPLVYDMDSTFGMQWDGSGITITAGGDIMNIADQALTRLMRKYYRDELRDRYIELRASGIFSVGNVNKLIRDFMVNIGEKGYEKEHETWTDIPSFGGTTSNVWFTGLDQIVSYVGKKIIFMDLKYGLIRNKNMID